MLQNGLYWSFYCSSVRNFVQVVIYDVIINLHIFYKCQGETSRTSLKWTNHQQPVSTTITPERPQLLVPLRKKKKKKIQTTKKKKKVAGSFFFSLQSSTIQLQEAKQSHKSGSVWEGSKPRTLVVKLCSGVFICQRYVFIIM